MKKKLVEAAQLKRSVVKNKVPQDLLYGEIAVNANSENPFLTIKDSAGNIIKLNDKPIASGDNVTLTDVLINGREHTSISASNYTVIESLTGTGKADVLYLYKQTDATTSAVTYTQYAYVDNAWVQVSSAEAIDINNYYTKTEVDNALANKADTSAVTAVNSSLTAHTADTDIHVTSADKTAWNAKSDFSGSYNDLTDKPTIPTVPTSNTAFTNDAGYITSGEAATQIEAATSGKADTSAVTEAISSAVSGKADTTAFTAYSAATDSRLAEDEEVTAAGLNALNDALGDKADTSAVTASIAAAVSGKQDTLIAGSGITISGNVISSEGGGGKAIVAGRGIEVTTGATADTVSFSLPISAGTGINSIRVAHTNNTASGLRSFAGGEGCTANKNDAFAFGLANTATSTGATAFGFKTNASVCSSFVCGKWNAIANANTGENFGSSGNTVFAVGNGWKKNDWTSGSANTHNALDIRQNGDIYFPDTDNTTYQNYYEKPMVRLQDMYGALGGLKLVKITQAAYDQLVTKDPNTLYVIVD